MEELLSKFLDYYWEDKLLAALVVWKQIPKEVKYRELTMGQNFTMLGLEEEMA